MTNQREKAISCQGRVSKGASAFAISHSSCHYLADESSHGAFLRSPRAVQSVHRREYIPRIQQRNITISEPRKKIKNYLKKYNTIRVAHQGFNKLNSIIKVQKDKLKKMLHTNVVYKIFCKDCDATYVGQTSRTLKTRIGEHKNHINWNTQQRSVIAEHRLEYSHEFDWNNIKILDEENMLDKRLTSEMIYIQKQKNSSNMQTDTELLNKNYECLFID
ncbi:hypothetical protein ALC57_08098 [Trachymyrmex cornetzi]|uniref:GIY-YIG domain-containing protein n=1 Tax=Trachymyrmex cornetzi TaxID=471704 RepID=A0A195E3Y4_9HYME|nr:hypothetical protein ALC57_08098 [Trachymyrmex cornetzi]